MSTFTCLSSLVNAKIVQFWNNAKYYAVFLSKAHKVRETGGEESTVYGNGLLNISIGEVTKEHEKFVMKNA